MDLSEKISILKDKKKIIVDDDGNYLSIEGYYLSAADIDDLLGINIFDDDDDEDICQAGIQQLGTINKTKHSNDMETIDKNKFYAVMDAVIRYGAHLYNESQCYHAIIDATKGDKEIAENVKTMLQRIHAEKNSEIPSAMNFESAKDITTFTRIGRKLCEVFNANNYYYGGNVYNHEMDRGAHIWIKPKLRRPSDNIKETSLMFIDESEVFKYFVEKAEIQ